jgi:exonuclease III
MSLNISSLNINGLLRPDKIYNLNDFLFERGVDVCLLQETHVSTISQLEKIKSILLSFNMYMPLSNNNTKVF